MLIFFSRHLSCGFVGFLKRCVSGVYMHIRVRYLQTQNRCLMGLNIVLIFFIVRLMPTLPKNFRINGRYLPRKLDGDLLRFGSQFICKTSVMGKVQGESAIDNEPSAPSSSVSTSTPPPPSPPESFACFRTSFQDRYVRSLLTFPRSCRIRNMRSSADRYRAPRRVARARA